MRRYEKHYIADILFSASCIVGTALWVFTSAFAPSTWLNLSVVGALLILGSTFYLGFIGQLNFRGCLPAILFSVVFLVAATVSLIFTSVAHDVKTYSHYFARAFSIVVLYLAPILVLTSSPQSPRLFRIGFSVGLFLCFMLMLYDFLRTNGIINFGLVPHLEGLDELDATYRTDIFRARGGSFEPGHDGAVTAALIPVVFLGIRTVLGIIFIAVLCLLMYYMGFSTSLALWAFAFLISYWFFAAEISLSAKIRALVSALIFGSAMIFFAEVLGITEDIQIKLESTSYDDRLVSSFDTLEKVYETVKTAIFGYGPGGYLVADIPSVTNTFTGVALDLGSLGLLCYLGIIVHAGYRIYSSRAAILKAGYVAYLLIYVMAIGNYWFPSHWIFLYYYLMVEAASTRNGQERSMFDQTVRS